MKNQKGFSQILLLLGAAAIAGLLIVAGFTQRERITIGIQKPLTLEEELSKIEEELESFDVLGAETDKELQEVQGELNDSVVSGL